MHDKRANHQEGEVALEDLIGVRRERIAHLSPEERARGGQLLRSADAFDTMRRAVEGDRILEGPDKENALSELHHLSEEADRQLTRWQREHGIE